MKRILIFAFLCLQMMMMSADIVKGRVVDADSGEPIEDAQIEMDITLAAEGWNWRFSFGTDSVGCFEWPMYDMARINLTINYFGYKPFKKNFNCAGGEKDTMDLGDLKLKMTDEMMKEVVVKGKAKRFYIKGDTVVFNPDAFNLEDGDRVATLLKKLPGVSIKDGKLYFMDKEVHLKMNGHDVAGDFLTGQLPAEAVQNVKAYEKKSEKTELTGVNDGQEEQILDITIKPGFLDKWYGQGKVSAYASRNYRVSGSANYLSENNPLNIFFRVSDNGARTGGVWGEYEWEDDNAVPQRQQMGNIGYRHNWKPKFVESSYEDNWNISTAPEHNDTYQNTWGASETYISGQPSTFSDSHSYDYNHNWEIPLEFYTRFHLSKKTWMMVNASTGFNRNESSTDSEQQTYGGDRYSTDSLSMVNSSTSNNSSRTDNGNFNLFARLVHIWDRGSYDIEASVNYDNSKGSSDSHSEYNYYELDSTEVLVQTTTNNSSNFQTSLDAEVKYEIIPKKLSLNGGYAFSYDLNNSKSENYRNGDFDFENSYDERNRQLTNEPRVELEADLDKLWMIAKLRVKNLNERFDYQRGNLDTLAYRNDWFLRPSFEFKWKATKTTELKGYAQWEKSNPALLDCMDYTDDTNPLNIVIGNPELKQSSNLNSELSYSMMFTKGQQMLTFKLDYARSFDPISSVMAYNSLTGAYITTNTNIDDRQNWSVGINYDRSLGPYFRLRNETNFNHTQDHGIKTVSSLDDPLEQYRQTSATIRENLNVTFQNNGWEASVWGKLNYSGINYSDPTITGQNLWGYQAGMKGEYKMKHWTFNLQCKLVGNDGYMSDMMNRKRCCLDASVTWKMLKNKGLLTFAAKDILNQMDQVDSSISPTMRSETKTETFHRYFSLTFTYNFDAKAKKGKEHTMELD